MTGLSSRTPVQKRLGRVFDGTINVMADAFELATADFPGQFLVQRPAQKGDKRIAVAGARRLPARAGVDRLEEKHAHGAVSVSNQGQIG